MESQVVGVGVGIIVALVLIAIFVVIFRWLWNSTVPEVFGLKELSFAHRHPFDCKIKNGDLKSFAYR